MLGLGLVRDYTSSTALMHPSFSGLLVTCAYLPHTTWSGSGVGIVVGLGLALGLGLEFGLVRCSHLARGRHQTKVGAVDLNDGALGDHA